MAGRGHTRPETALQAVIVAIQRNAGIGLTDRAGETVIAAVTGPTAAVGRPPGEEIILVGGVSAPCKQGYSNNRDDR